MYDTEFTLAAVGDAIATRKLSVHEEPQFHAVLERIREADSAFANLEVLLHDYEGYPAAESGGTYMRAPPSMADELAWAGFDLFAAATNHAGDFSHGGMIATMEALEERDLAYAGLGRNLATAREPTYLETPGGRIALVSACTTITPGTVAGRQRPDMGGRPGVSPLRLRTRYDVPESVRDAIVEMSEHLGLEDVKARREKLGFPVPGEDADGFTLMNVGGETDLTFEVGDEHRVRRTVDEEDAEAIRRQIAAARTQADRVLVSLHTHECVGGYFNDTTVPAFLESFARDCIDAGADAFLGHGPHVLRGIELYGGAPIFYSLGNFLMQNETVSRLPADIYERYDLDPSEALPAELFEKRVRDDDGDPIGFLADRRYWESALPICGFDEDGLVELELYPLNLGRDRPRSRRGRPLLAEDETAERILDDLRELSAPYDTEIELEDGVGKVVV